MTLTKKLQKLTDDLAKIQGEMLAKGYNIDMERAMILLEGHVQSLRQYEALEDDTDHHVDKDMARAWGIDD